MEALSVVFSIGPFAITRTVVTTWGILLVLGFGCWLATRRLSVEQPGMMQSALEGVVQAIDSAIATVLAERSTLLLPFVGTLWIFVAVANLIGLIPGLHAPTGDLSTTMALAVLVFLSVHWYGIRSAGPRAYLRHYLSPSPVLLPFHILGEFSRTLALAVRLFGNIMSLEMAALLVLLVAGLLVPVPVLMLHVIEALVQAYIFGMLVLIYIAGGMQSQAEQTSTHSNKEGNKP
ncbi:MAG TPA: F0F1 ATP synthase subunit A [Accumulibacter sp.]|uniref:F0F1 ATP synthase subunit A n=1 Tax=Accumulibacter sp. TaxID=2053492 RepID=UPI0028795541|nr:F0F1 ATP synthase subunit A [Accumulibacter sp.]MDS4056180.1 F0F1 ATP synthase subunit A [Accumulibacter sp.]HMW63736.1 F0F1 ATP synthase subunit A [Accumulibacter sp.]HNB68028.1 F0F1 ATP synthase subunit A [Accumulibacter sp.]HND39381.1 F0F1 ATP synthase subunit A [Accumulibacter sp.]HNE40911.1 F0F1 ATP synthase subunit A [Accumulibacter sp.]